MTERDPEDTEDLQWALMRSARHRPGFKEFTDEHLDALIEVDLAPFDIFGLYATPEMARDARAVVVEAAGDVSPLVEAFDRAVDDGGAVKRLCDRIGL